jgi:hypothetical protein
LAFFADPTVFGTSPSQLQQRIDDVELVTGGSQRTFGDEIVNYLDSETLDVMLDVDGNGVVTNEDYQLAFFADPTVFGTSPSQLQQRIDDLELTTENSARKTATEIIEFLQRFFPAADSRNFGGTQGNIVSRSNTTNMGQVFIGNDQLHEFTGSNKDDTFYSGTGDELLTGGGGSNTFVFGINNGNDTITDFKVSQDIIRIVNDSSLGFTNTSDIVDSLTRESDSLSQLSLGSGFLNINHDQPLSASNFVLV